jgi:hypothetical protein
VFVTSVSGFSALAGTFFLVGDTSELDSPDEEMRFVLEASSSAKKKTVQ